MRSRGNRTGCGWPVAIAKNERAMIRKLFSTQATMTSRQGFRVVGLLLATLFSWAIAQAQQPATPPTAPPAQAPTAPQAGTPAGQAQTDETPTVVHLGVNEDNLIFTVTDKRGRYIPNLQQSDFALA